MKIKTKQLINLLVDQNEQSISGIFSEYQRITLQLQNSKDQSWYFQKAMASKRKRLAFLTKEYEDIRKQFNQMSLDEMIKELNNTYDEEKELEKRDHMGLIGHFCLAHILNKRNLLNEMISLKNSVNELMPIEYYTTITENAIDIIVPNK